ncbi:HlyD family type I secretion periplasmic adaptor subunit [Ruegeria jejuensis]|uniref:HlyD family type I secretion periplasmic adaptor subunit n=1 Tax=Ruegeria jejuensis TaxID=3233338 RepID=UPI00355B319E
MSDAKNTLDPVPAEGIGGWTFTGLALGVGLLAGLVVWSLNTRIDGAVVAPGMVGLETDRQVVQHLEGGIVANILVREDQAVTRGQVLLELDTTQDQTELNATASQIANLTVRRARLTAELDGAEFPPADLGLAITETTRAIIAAEWRLFRNRSESRHAEAALLETRRQALAAQIDGLRSQSHSLTADMALTEEELTSVISLHDKGLVPVTRLLEVRRSKLDIDAGLSGNAAQIKSLQAQIAEVDSQLRSARATTAEEIAINLAETDQQLRELRERRASLWDRVQRSRVTAPGEGRILNLAVHTRGGVIAPGQPIMEIVPVQEDTILTANIPVTEIDRVMPGQEAIVRFTAFNLGQTPELQGQVRSVSADTLTDPATGNPYYSAEIMLSEAELARLGGQELVPGMPANVHITTGERLVASYLSRPLVDAFAETFRDE